MRRQCQLTAYAALWGGTTGLAMVCPIFLGNKLPRKMTVNHESPYVVPPLRAPLRARLQGTS
ncbi:hypothetical protein F4555_001686 [Mobiluncus mulieris]|uniref:Uncharacterized protein n=1 Tax=Mobiluncus mulieris TaxID=2052 RepID=A0A8G2HU27_9ACTO|nr:hypothetical protein [Mobiluncus mulieris]SPX70113.1 Uncharacterised protein [Mobiluncus mulieris]STO16648.1 Uncharacterised protein [Mobiluncus mulieris]